MNTREIAEEYRLSHWAEIMRERKESGLSIRVYCKQAGIHENVYYYWQKKLREAALEELTVQGDAKTLVPEGWALCTAKPGMPMATSSEQVSAEVQGIRITAGSAYPVEQLTQLLRELLSGC